VADDAWSLADAKAKFSEVVERALTQGPQRVTRHGKDAVVIVRADEWARRTKKPATLLEFFQQSPLQEAGADLDLERNPDAGRAFRFE
jgi:prevent-host-death family protein